MFLPELGKQIQGERHITSNNRVIRISAGSNNRESTVSHFLNQANKHKHYCYEKSFQDLELGFLLRLGLKLQHHT